MPFGLLSGGGCLCRKQCLWAAPCRQWWDWILKKWMMPSFRIKYYRLNRLTGGADLGCVWLSLLWKGCCRQLPVLPEHWCSLWVFFRQKRWKARFCGWTALFLRLCFLLEYWDLRLWHRELWNGHRTWLQSFRSVQLLEIVSGVSWQVWQENGNGSRISVFMSRSRLLWDFMRKIKSGESEPRWIVWKKEK